MKPFDHPQHVLRCVASKYGVRAGDVTGPRSTNTLRTARWEIVQQLREQGRSFEEIGEVICRSGSTVRAIDFARETAIPREERLRMHTLRIRSHAEFVAGTETYDEVSTEGLET